MRRLNQKNWYQIFQALFLSFSCFSHTLLVFHSPLICTFICGCAAAICVCVCVCGCDLVIVDDYRSQCFLSPLRKHICSKSHSLRQHTPRLPLTRCIMSVLCPIDQMTAAVEPRRQLQKVHLSLFGPRDAPRSKLTDRHAATKSHRGACSLALQRKRGVNDP